MQDWMDQAIAEKQAQFDALDEQSSCIMGLAQLAHLQNRKAAVLRELQELKERRNASQ